MMSFVFLYLEQSAVSSRRVVHVVVYKLIVGAGTVKPEFFARILSSRMAFKDILSTGKFRD